MCRGVGNQEPTGTDRNRQGPTGNRYLLQGRNPEIGQKRNRSLGNPWGVSENRSTVGPRGVVGLSEGVLVSFAEGFGGSRGAQTGVPGGVLGWCGRRVRFEKMLKSIGKISKSRQERFANKYV